MPTKDEAEVFVKMTRLNIIKEQMAIKKELEDVYKRINQVLELIREIVRKLEKKKEEEIGSIKIKSRKKTVEIIPLQGKITEI